jgi:hypothetical protein
MTATEVPASSADVAVQAAHMQQRMHTWRGRAWGMCKCLCVCVCGGGGERGGDE